VILLSRLASLIYCTVDRFVAETLSIMEEFTVCHVCVWKESLQYQNSQHNKEHTCPWFRFLATHEKCNGIGNRTGESRVR
jgi:hypothetical protein